MSTELVRVKALEALLGQLRPPKRASLLLPVDDMRLTVSLCASDRTVKDSDILHLAFLLPQDMLLSALELIDTHSGPSLLFKLRPSPSAPTS